MTTAGVPRPLDDCISLLSIIITGLPYLYPGDTGAVLKTRLCIDVTVCNCNIVGLGVSW